MATTSLDGLPAEILQRIASIGSAESVLALTRTCRTLYRACHATVVYKAIIESHRPLWEDPNILDIPTLSRYVGSDYPLAWARFALADQKALELHRALSMEAKGGSQSIDDHYYQEHCEDWLPHLLIVKYPITQMRCWLWLRFCSPRHFQFKLSLRGQFCFTAAMMSIPENEPYQGPAFWPREELSTRKHGSLIESLSAMAAFAVVLKEGILTGRTFRRTITGTVTAPFLIPPPAHKIPMLPLDSTCQLPLPFHSIRTDPDAVEDPWTKWLHRHVAKMLESEFLMTGKWCGYYDYDQEYSIDAPMMAIQFTIDPSPTLASATTRQVQGEGHDGVGPFTLGGAVAADGRFFLRKTYIDGFIYTLDWDCSMTPFGIFGRWRFDEPNSLSPIVYSRGGTLWLWKEEWNG